MKAFEYIGTALAVLGTLIIATGHAHSVWPWSIMIVASFFLLYWSFGIKAWAFFALNIVYICLDVIGLYNALH